jgi:hypothetical protein
MGKRMKSEIAQRELSDLVILLLTVYCPTAY